MVLIFKGNDFYLFTRIFARKLTTEQCYATALALGRASRADISAV